MRSLITNHDLKSKLKKIIDLALKANIASKINLYIGYGHSCSNNDLLICAGKSDGDTIFDLASLTKILGTVPLVAHALLAGKLSLNEKPFECWPQISIKNLLSHKSGLVPHVKFYEHPGVINKESFFAELFKQKPQFEPDKIRVYSDLNFLALGYLLEKRYKNSLSILFSDIFRHIHPNLSLKKSPKGIRVNDDNCHFLGGLAGHAGLFGKISDVALMGRFFLGCFNRPENNFSYLIKYMINNYLGFDRPKIGGSIEKFSNRAFGHFGFTGTSLWVDPKAGSHGIYVALLTNRVEHSIDPKLIFWLRKKVHDCIIKYL